MGLEMFDAAPFWSACLRSLGYSVRFSRFSNRQTFYDGQFTIPSDTVCYPAKLMHGHVEQLVAEGEKAIFYPCCTYNFAEEGTDNSYHCPVVAYYSELLHSSVRELEGVDFMFPYLDMSDDGRLAYSLDRYFRDSGKTAREPKRFSIKRIRDHKPFRNLFMQIFTEPMNQLLRHLKSKQRVIYFTLKTRMNLILNL